MCASFILMPDIALAKQTLFSSFRCACACVRVCQGVCVCECNTNLKRWPVYIVCACLCVRVCTFTYVCVSVYLFGAGDPPHAQVMSLLSQMWKVHKNNVREMGKVPSPSSEVFSRNGLFSSLCSCFAVTVTRTHAQAYAHAHTHAHAAHSNTSAHSHTHQTHAQNTCMLTHAHMQTHWHVDTHKMQAIDTKDIDIDALALDFVTNLSLNAE